VYIFIIIAVSHTNISEKIILIFVINLIGKSSKNPASAIGVQKTKKDQVSKVTIKPLFKPYLMETNMKYIARMSKIIRNLERTDFFVS